MNKTRFLRCLFKPLDKARQTQLAKDQFEASQLSPIGRLPGYFFRETNVLHTFSEIVTLPPSRLIKYKPFLYTAFLGLGMGALATYFSVPVALLSVPMLNLPPLQLSLPAALTLISPAVCLRHLCGCLYPFEESLLISQLSWLMGASSTLGALAGASFFWSAGPNVQRMLSGLAIVGVAATIPFKYSLFPPLSRENSDLQTRVAESRTQLCASNWSSVYLQKAASVGFASGVLNGVSGIPSSFFVRPWLSANGIPLGVSSRSQKFEMPKSPADYSPPPQDYRISPDEARAIGYQSSVLPVLLTTALSLCRTRVPYFLLPLLTLNTTFGSYMAAPHSLKLDEQMRQTALGQTLEENDFDAQGFLVFVVFVQGFYLMMRGVLDAGG